VGKNRIQRQNKFNFNFELVCRWRHDTRHNDIRHNNIQHKDLFVTLSLNESQRNQTIIMLSVAFYLLLS
jgi:hypothetical protein